MRARPGRRRGRAAELLAEHGDELAADVGLPRAAARASSASIPSYYLRYFYRHDECSPSSSTATPRAATVAEIERELLELYRDPALDEKPALLEQRGGAFYSEAATALVASLATGDGDVQVVDVRNDGTLAGLADDDVVEVPARIERGGPVPLPQAPLAPELLGLVAARRRLRAARGRGGASTRRPRRRAQGAARAPADRPAGAVDELVERLLAADASTCRGSRRR